MDKSLDELITLNKRRGTRGGDDGTGYSNPRNKTRGARGNGARRTVPYEPPSSQANKKEDLSALIANYLPTLTAIAKPIIDYDNSGRSLGTATIFFESPVDVLQAKNTLDGLTLLDSIVKTDIDEVTLVIPDSGGVLNDEGEYMYRSILDRLGSKRPAPISGVAAPGSVLERLGSRVLDRLGPTVIYSNNSRGGRGHRQSNTGGRRRDVSTEELDKQMDAYLNGDGQPMSLDDDNVATVNKVAEQRIFGRKQNRQEFIDFDSPAADPYTTVGGGHSSGRVLLNYDDI
ncbi:hypothetical protein HK100_007351 [Physocladia obscura]|uniref:Chromatin target of PRMT1 protein C-terminal domain-containing protein n=1 Tax=Physocladia obscura TaxID=109957 RepID=A0AAD5XEX5_9FUNG|nr:hypothetical protein HK100_007351 [Physocladia obscura]